MRAYLVRAFEDHDLVGVFVASNLEQLQELVDECTNIDQCEYAPLPAGGIMWEGTAVAIPAKFKDEDDNSDPIPWHGAGPSGSWWDGFYGSISGWKRLLDTEETPTPSRPRLRVVKR